MGDVMHLKRQTVVERLKKRFDHYRRHHNSCLPKYEQATSALYETQRQDTLLLKQRFLESKAKKAKTKSDHHRVYKEPSADTKSQLHSKPLKRSAEDHPRPTSTPDALSNEDSEKPSKMARQATPDLPPPPQSSLPPTFSVQQIVQQQFSSKQGGSPAAAATPPHPVECKQEKEDSDLCQFQQQQDRLPDCLVEFSDEAGDNELSLEPETLKALYEELISNPAGLPDFNLEDSVGSVKDSDEKDIMDLVKGQGAYQNGLSFANSPGSQQNGLFDTIPASSDASMSPLSVTTTTSAGFYTGPSQQQRLPSYGSPNMSHSNGLVLDFKMSEPSPAALTLKQMAEQHQNMQQKQQQQQQQQQQMVNPTQMNNRSPAFNQESFSSHLNNLRPSNFLNGSSPAVQTNSPKMPNSGTSMFTSFEQHLSNFPANEVMNNFPTNCEPVSPNNLFESDIRSRNNPTSLNESNIRGLQMKLSNMEQQQQKPPAYNSTRPLTHFSDSAQSGVRQQNLANAQQQQQNSMNRQFQSNTGVRMQIPQVPQLQPRQRNAQQIQQEDPKQQQQHLMQPHSNMYTSYSTQQQTGSPSFNATMSQALPYSNQFTSNTVMSRPPPEYKATTHHQQQHNVATDNLHLVEQLNAPSQVMFNQPTKNKFVKQQRPPNVTITPDGTAISSSHEWRTNVLGNQAQQNQFRVSPFSHQENYRSINSNVTPTVNVPLSPIYNQYRMPTNQMPNNRLSRPTNMQQNHMMVQQRQRMAVSQRPRMPSMPGLESHNSMGMNTNSMSPNKVMGPMYSEQEISRQDNSDNYLDFLEDIESSASDLLSFDPVMQGPHFPILDDMDI